MDLDEKLAMVRAMRTFGGSFVEALSECFLLADSENLQRLIIAFPEIVDQYKEMAKYNKKQEDE